MVASIFFSMAAPITAYFKDSDWLLKNFDPIRTWLKKLPWRAQGYRVKEHEKLVQKQVSKVTLHFVWGHFSRKQTVARVCADYARPAV